MAKKNKHIEHEEHVDESWLIPYADLMTLLLALFLVLFASSSVNKKKFDAMANAFNSVFSGGSGLLEGTNGLDPNNIPSVTEPDDINDIEEPSNDIEELIEKGELDNLEQLKSTLETYFHENDLDTSVKTYIDERGLVISLNNAILFDSGSAVLKVGYAQTLLKIANTINVLDNYIRIEGHTDNVPIYSSKYESNWELSAARATNVVRLFISDAKINPEKMVAVGYGEFKPIANNSTVEGRAQNRRVDIIILNSKYKSLEEIPPVID